jgi:hypothetical protein
MTETGLPAGLIIALVVAAVALVLAGLLFRAKGRLIPGPHVFRASRFSRGNFLFPTQVSITPTSVVHFTPELFGGREQSMHLAHVASVVIDRNLFFSDVMIESSGGASPVRCHGHRKRDALEMKRLIEQFQSEHYRDRRAGTPAEGRAS